MRRSHLVIDHTGTKNKNEVYATSTSCLLLPLFLHLLVGSDSSKEDTNEKNWTMRREKLE